MESSDDDARLFLKRRSGGGDLATPFLLSLHGQHIADAQAASPGFATRLRRVALETLEGQDPAWLRRALGALAFVGTKEDVTRISLLMGHSDEGVAKDAGTCLFEIRKRTAP
jgi:hypothetical protein